MISLVFIRHGATEGNLEKRYIGKTDEPLCNEGINQALKLREFNFKNEYIFVSPMKRACETARLIFPDANHTVVDDFKETDFGAFEGKSASELSENPEYIKWVDSMCTGPIPGGEDMSVFKSRCVNAFKKTVEGLPDDAEVVFVIHGGVIMAILEALSADKGDFYDYQLKNGEFIRCKFDNGKIITGVSK